MSDPFAAAVGHWQAGRYAEAAAGARAALAAEPDHAQAANLLGLALYRDGKAAEAVEVFVRALRRRPRPDLLNNLALAQGALKQTPEAVGNLQAAIALKPDYVDAYANLGRLLRRNGNPGGAVTALRRALALDPDHMVALADLGAAHFARDEMDQAWPPLARYVELLAPVVATRTVAPGQDEDEPEEQKKPDLPAPLFRAALEAAARVLADAGAPFFLAAGTALGVARDGAFIRFDKDIDLGLFADVDRGRIYAGFDASPDFWFTSPPAGGDVWMVSASYREMVAVDLFFHAPTADGGLWQGINRGAFVTRWRTGRFGTRPVAALGATYAVPDPLEPYLTDLYGDWRTPDPDYCGWVTGEIEHVLPDMAFAYALSSLKAALAAGQRGKAANIARRLGARLAQLERAPALRAALAAIEENGDGTAGQRGGKPGR